MTARARHNKHSSVSGTEVRVGVALFMSSCPRSVSLDLLPPNQSGVAERSLDRGAQQAGPCLQCQLSNCNVHLVWKGGFLRPLPAAQCQLGTFSGTSVTVRVAKKKRFSVVHSVCQDGRQIVSGPQCGCDCYAQILPPHGVNGHCLRLNEQSGMERS